jgi:hypothetical protein
MPALRFIAIEDRLVSTEIVDTDGSRKPFEAYDVR